jgi:hypothetical protein
MRKSSIFSYICACMYSISCPVSCPLCRRSCSSGVTFD